MFLGLCSQVPMFPGFHVPRVPCYQGSMFPEPYVPRVPYSIYSAVFQAQILRILRPHPHMSCVLRVLSFSPMFPWSYVYMFQSYCMFPRTVRSNSIVFRPDVCVCFHRIRFPLFHFMSGEPYVPGVVRSRWWRFSRKQPCDLSDPCVSRFRFWDLVASEWKGA